MESTKSKELYLFLLDFLNHILFLYSIILPLLKMEYLAHLEKAMEQSALKTAILAEIDYSAPHKHRDYVFAKCKIFLN